MKINILTPAASVLSELFCSPDPFQTPMNVCEYMAAFLPDKCGTILEPTPGKGNLVTVLHLGDEEKIPRQYRILYFQWIKASI